MLVLCTKLFDTLSFNSIKKIAVCNAEIFYYRFQLTSIILYFATLFDSIFLSIDSFSISFFSLFFSFSLSFSLSITICPAYCPYFIIPWAGTVRADQAATDWNVYSKGWMRNSTACRLWFITRVPMKYTFSASKWIRKLIFDGYPGDSTSFFNFPRAPSPPHRRDVIVKYDYSVSRRLFLTLVPSPSLILVCICNRRKSTNDRSV